MNAVAWRKAAPAPAWLLPCLGGGIVALTLVALSLHVPGSIWVGTLARKDAVVALMLASGLLYFAAVMVLLRGATSVHVLWHVLAISTALRVGLLCAPPFMSSDIYRYVWDGRVQAAGHNPYQYIAADPALTPLRDNNIYPRINRVEYAHTIYPPAAQLIFAAVGQVSQTVTAMKIAMVLLESCGVAAMIAMLRAAGRPAAHILIYAWNPLAAWAIAGDGHIDGAAIGFLGLAMWAMTARRDGIAGALLSGAILTKLLPLAVAPALWRRYHWRLPLVCACCIVAFYAIYANVGWRVLGFLPAYTSEEGLTGGSGFWLLRAVGDLVTLPSWIAPLYLAVAVISLAAVALWVGFAQPRDTARDPVSLARNVALLATATVFAMSPHYTWYYAWLALPACLVPWPSLIWLATAPILLYSDPWHDEILLPTAVFVPFLCLAARDLLRARAAPHPILAGAPT